MSSYRLLKLLLLFPYFIVANLFVFLSVWNPWFRGFKDDFFILLDTLSLFSLTANVLHLRSTGNSLLILPGGNAYFEI